MLLPDNVVSKKSNFLKGKTIAFAITGSIASIETPQLIRELRRHGAIVKVYVTTSALNFIGKSALEWASTNTVINAYSSHADHVCNEDIVLIIPATANTISKITNGIQDNPVTSIVASALGQNQQKKNCKKIFFLPTMHASLQKNPFYLENETKLKMKSQVFFLDSKIEENKHKIPSKESIVSQILHHYHNDRLPEKLSKGKIFVTGGNVPTYIDDVRMINNKFSGQTAIDMSTRLYQLGIPSILLMSRNNSLFIPDFLLPQTYFYQDYQDYREEVLKILEKEKIILGVFSAAVADYQPKNIYPRKNTFTKIKKYRSHSN